MIKFLLMFQEVLTATISHQDYERTNKQQGFGEVAAFLSKNGLNQKQNWEVE